MRTRTATARVAIAALAAASAAGAQAPGTDLYVASITRDAAGAVTLGPARAIAPEPGYDSQPFFLAPPAVAPAANAEPRARGARLLFTSDRAGDQTEIFELVLDDTVDGSPGNAGPSTALRRLTDTAESEFSPTPVPWVPADGGDLEFSAVRVEADGTQRLWSFPGGGGAPRLLLPEVKPVGYHAWIDTRDVLLFVLGEPHTLRRASLVTGAAGPPLVERPGRAIHRVPAALRGGPRMSYVAARDGAPWVHLYDPATGASEGYAPAFSGDAEAGHDLAWMADGTLLMSRGATIGAWVASPPGGPGTQGAADAPAAAGEATGWRTVGDFAAQGIAGITRLAVSPSGERLVFVAADAPGAGPARRALEGHAMVAAAGHAREKGDWVEARRQLARAARYLPAQPGLVRRLAGAEARDGRAARALERLESLVRWRARALLDTDPDLEAVRALAGYAAFRERWTAALAPEERSTESFRLATPDFVPEGIAFDAATERFFVSSVRWGRIEVRDRAGAVRRFADLRGLGFGGSVLGLAVDPVRGALWAVLADLEQAADRPAAPRGSTALCELDLDDGRVRRCLAPPVEPTSPAAAEADAESGPGSGPATPEARPAHLFNDLVVGADGAVFVSDPPAGAIHRLAAPGGPDPARLEPFLDEAWLSSPGGLALSADGRRLFVADYALGVLAVDLAAPAPRAIALASDDAVLVGIDGLARFGRSLVAIQNGVLPPRILRLDLDASGERLETVAVLEFAHSAWDEPTLGTVVGEEFHYVSNSHWPQFGENGVLPGAESLAPPIIRRLPLGPVATGSGAGPSP